MNTQTSFHRFLQVISRHFVPNIGTVLAVILLLFVYNTQAASTTIERSPASPNVSPSTISYQGTLSTASGDPVNGSVGMTFRLYNVSSGGSALWTETRTSGNAVPVSNGLFHVLLGNLTPIPASIWENTNVYLGVQIEGDNAELSPREMVGAVPVAMMATNIVIPDSSVTTDKIADGAVTLAKLGEHPYYFSADFATSSEWVADLIFNENYARFCEAIGLSYSRGETLTRHWDDAHTNGIIYTGWYYTGRQISSSDTHMWGDGDPNSPYNAWKYNGGAGWVYSATDRWSYRLNALIWCK